MAPAHTTMYKHDPWPNPEEEGHDGNYKAYTMEVTAADVQGMVINEENVAKVGPSAHPPTHPPTH